MAERVISPMGGEHERDLIRPDQLELAIVNQFGIEQGHLLRQLDFEPVNERIGRMLLMRTPKEILGRAWGLYYQEGVNDPRLFTVCIQIEPSVYAETFRQIPHPRVRGEYCIFFI